MNHCENIRLQLASLRDAAPVAVDVVLRVDRVDGPPAGVSERAWYFRPIGTRCNAQLAKCVSCGSPNSSYRAKRCRKCGADLRCPAPIGVGMFRCQRHGQQKSRKRNKRKKKVGNFRDVRLRRRFSAAMQSIDLKSVLEDVALLATRLSVVKEQLGEDGSHVQWNALRVLAREVRAKRKAKQDHADLIGEMLKTISAGCRSRDLWDEAIMLAEKIAGLKKLQSSIERDGKFYLSLSEALAMSRRMGVAINTAISKLKDHYRTVAECFSVGETNRIAAEIAGALGITDETQVGMISARIQSMSGVVHVEKIGKSIDGVGLSVVEAIDVGKMQ